jgi:hypothetical protein
MAQSLHFNKNLQFVGSQTEIEAEALPMPFVPFTAKKHFRSRTQLFPVLILDGMQGRQAHSLPNLQSSLNRTVCTPKSISKKFPKFEYMSLSITVALSFASMTSAFSFAASDSTIVSSFAKVEHDEF